MIGNLVGSTLTKPLLIGAAALTAVLLAVIAAQGVAIWWLNGQVESARKDYAALAEKNGRCEAESAGLKDAVTACTEATAEWKRQATEAQAVSAAALEAARRDRPLMEKRIRDILGAQPQYPDDLCRSACALLREGVRK